MIEIEFYIDARSASFSITRTDTNEFVSMGSDRSTVSGIMEDVWEEISFYGFAR